MKGAGWVSEEGGGGVFGLSFLLGDLHQNKFRIHVQRPQESKIIKLLKTYGPCGFWWAADGEIPFGRSLLWADT